MKPMAAKLYRSMRNLMVKLGWLSTWYYGHDGIIYIRVLYIYVCVALFYVVLYGVITVPNLCWWLSKFMNWAFLLTNQYIME